MMRFNDLPHGQEIKRDDPDYFAVDIHQCFIHETLKVFNAQELTQIFCSSDDRLSEVLPKIELKRTQTLDRGGEKCDFCWCRKIPDEI